MNELKGRAICFKLVKHHHFWDLHLQDQVENYEFDLISQIFTDIALSIKIKKYKNASLFIILRDWIRVILERASVFFTPREDIDLSPFYISSS